MSSSFRKFTLATVAASAVALSLGTMSTPAEARSHVSVGVGFGFPVYGPGYYAPTYYPDYGYRPYYRHRHYRPYYYGPPPVMYRPAPVYAPAYEPIQAEPTSPAYRRANGQYCREYQSRVRIEGRMRTTYGTACQQSDGVWRIVN